MSVDLKPIQETVDELPGFVEWLKQFVQAMRQVWTKKENRRSRPAKIIERR